MLQIINPSGINLAANPPVQTTYSIPDTQSTVNVRLDCYITEEDLDYTFRRINGTVMWPDDSWPDVYSGTGTVALNLAHALPAGDHIVRVEASNYNLPAPNRISANFSYHVVAPADSVPARIVYGPILPKDVGFPNKTQWNFDTGSDLEILASSVKMLLTTAKGERIMLPEYGTNIRMILFEFASAGVESMVQQEIVDALTKWEPRVLLQFLSVEKTGDREYTVQATFISKLNQQPFTSTLSFK
jgi:phage baseplate assembly protein W